MDGEEKKVVWGRKAKIGRDGRSSEWAWWTRKYVRLSTDAISHGFYEWVNDFTYMLFIYISMYIYIRGGYIYKRRDIVKMKVLDHCEFLIPLSLFISHAMPAFSNLPFFLNESTKGHCCFCRSEVLINLWPGCHERWAFGRAEKKKNFTARDRDS